MHFSKMTSIALALAPLAMAGSCPVKKGSEVKPGAGSDVLPTSSVPAAAVTPPANGHKGDDKPHGKVRKPKAKHHKGKKTTAAPTATPTAAAPEPKRDTEKPAPKRDTEKPAPKPDAEKPSSAVKKPNDPLPDNEWHDGPGTRYDHCTEADCWQKGACAMTDYTLPPGVDGTTCLSELIFDKGAHCGGCIEANYKGKTHILMVTNQTDGEKFHLDMTPATWAKVSQNSPWGGGITVHWRFVKCPIVSPLKIKMHFGASRYWFAASVENATYRVHSLEVSSDEGETWVSTARDPKVNVFTIPNQKTPLPSDKAWIRVTSVEGNVLIVKDVTLASDKSTKASANF
ncbi:hypothetical protein E4U53_003209 [Claviceps sorghi]|nr:hypothetical protein E4U53_003209 [Claviceps sorghi]